MSANILAIVIPLAGVAIMPAWVPLLNLICPPCTHSPEGRRFQREALDMRSHSFNS
jgi:hypothetical protein